MVYFKCVQINLQHSRSVALDLSQLIHYGHNIDIALIQEPYAKKRRRLHHHQTPSAFHNLSVTNHAYTAVIIAHSSLNCVIESQ